MKGLCSQCMEWLLFRSQENLSDLLSKVSIRLKLLFIIPHEKHNRDVERRIVKGEHDPTLWAKFQLALLPPSPCFPWFKDHQPHPHHNDAISPWAPAGQERASSQDMGTSVQERTLCFLAPSWPPVSADLASLLGVPTDLFPRHFLHRVK